MSSMPLNLDAIVRPLSSVGLAAMPRTSNPLAWEEAWIALEYQAVPYDEAMIDYQHAYYRSAGWEIMDASLVLLCDGRPCGLWPLSLGGPPGQRQLTSAGGAVLAPMFVSGLSPRTIKKICGRAIAFIHALCAQLALPSPVVEQGNEPSLGVSGRSEWHQQLLAAGASVTLKHELYTDLQPSLADIRATFRKSYRPLINAGLREWDVFVLDRGRPDQMLWEEFKQMHGVIAGRRTRSDETWQLQYNMLATGRAFLVGLRNRQQGNLVGAGFFQVTRDEGLYSVGVYDRTLFDKPLGHVVQQIAIETMRGRSVRWYCIGERHYHQDEPVPTQKMVSIAEFKQGFASHLFCRFQFQLPLPAGDVTNELVNL
jgi:FemAB family protein